MGGLWTGMGFQTRRAAAAAAAALLWAWLSRPEPLFQAQSSVALAGRTPPESAGDSRLQPAWACPASGSQWALCHGLVTRTHGHCSVTRPMVTRRNWLAYCSIYFKIVHIVHTARVSIYCTHCTKVTKLYPIVRNCLTHGSIYQYCSIVRNWSTCASIV